MFLSSGSAASCGGWEVVLGFVANVVQNIEKAFKETGYKTQVQPLAHFHDDYGLKPKDGEEEEEEEEEEDDEEEGSGDEYTDDSDSDGR